MNHSDMPEGYGSPQIPFQPSPLQNPSKLAAPVPPPRTKQPEKQQARMPKAQALALVRRMKQGVMIGSLLCFGTVAGLIVNQTNLASAQQATQQTTTSSTTSQAKTSTATPKVSATSTSTPSPTATATTTNKNTTTTSSSSTGTSSQASSTQQGGGYGFGSTQAAQPVSGSQTS